MLVQPVISRELRVQARARGTYWLRVLAGGTAAVVFGVGMVSRNDLSAGQLGPWLFALLHTSLCIVLGLACPFMTADTLAGERREGTLGLLLLTPLRPRDVVFGKMSVHLLRAFTLWLSVLPVLIVPLMLGGVTLLDIGIALAFECSVVLFSLAGGLLASSYADRWGAAMALAAFGTALFGEVLALGASVVVLMHAWIAGVMSHTNLTDWPELLMIATLAPWAAGTGLTGGNTSGWSALLAVVPTWLRHAFFIGLGMIVLGSLFIFARVCWLAARRLQTIGQGSVRTARQESRRRFWFRVRAPAVYYRGRRALLELNPLLWLYTLQPSLRLNRWAWCGLVVVVWCFFSVGNLFSNDTEISVILLPAALTTALTFAASAAYRREMAEGTLELLLVTPLRPVNILRARIGSLWMDFFPALALTTGLTLWWSGERPGWNNNSPNFDPLLLGIWSSFLTTPFIAARFAVRRVNPISSWLWTVGLGIGLPFLMGAVSAGIADVNGIFGWRWICVVVFALFQFFLGGLCAWATVTDLESRRFLLKPFARSPQGR